jgi:hypothetical protein
MNWKIKAAVQNACAALPIFREELYFNIQKTFGDPLNNPDPLDLIRAAADLAGLLQAAGSRVEGARIFEVGTGRRVDMPIGMFLAGAKSVTTVDLHRYLKPELVMRSLQRIRENRAKVTPFFARVADPRDFERRFDVLCSVAGFDDLIAKTHITYHAPADAAATGLPSGSFDLHISYTVFEHIPAAVLEAILKESNRLLTSDGVALHHIDLSDHFAQEGTITKINFLQYSSGQWASYADNQFAYHNRLRPGDYRAIYNAAGHNVWQWSPFIDPVSMTTLKAGFPIHSDFRDIPPEELCTDVLRVLSRPKQAKAHAAQPGL